MISVDATATAELVERASGLLEGDPHAVGPLLGPIPGPSAVSFGVWVPEQDVTAVDVEFLLPPDGFDPASPPPAVDMDRVVLPMELAGAFAWLVATGVPVGTRTRVGALYRLVIHTSGVEVVRPDPLAWSMPFGAFGPAEVIDTAEITRSRSDREHFVDDGERMPAPTSILQVHVPTATSEGTLAALTDHYRALAARVVANETGPDDDVWLGYDAVELMPVEPTITFETGPPMFAADVDGDRATVTA
ncbi:MAG: glucosylglycerol hydrolase, partial [Acidimicrobiia bacterium]|nr:glucosylglycerol hydrolase [Acidimicrobiia bacterium]